MTNQTLLRAAVALAAILFHFASPVLAADGRKHTLHSRILGEERTLTVHLPPSYQEQVEFSYPVVYLLDGESNADYAVAVSDFLADVAAIPEVITVALHAGATRSRDYLPPNPGGPNGTRGEADRFLDHLEREVLPYVEAEYRAAPLRLVSGHSVGGLLVIHALLQRPGLFDAHLGQSPYLDETVGSPLMERLAARSSSAGESSARTSEAFYYFNLGDEPQLAPRFGRLQPLLAQSHNGITEIETNKGHMETRLVGHYKGLELFFADTWRFSPESHMKKGSDDFTAYVSHLNSTFGYKVLLGESLFQAAVQKLFSTQDVAGARAIGDLYVDYHPRSPIAHFLLANARAATGSREDALRSIDSAISLFEAAPKEELATLYQAMQQLQTSLRGN